MNLVDARVTYISTKEVEYGAMLLKHYEQEYPTASKISLNDSYIIDVHTQLSKIRIAVNRPRLGDLADMSPSRIRSRVIAQEEREAWF